MAARILHTYFGLPALLLMFPSCASALVQHRRGVGELAVRNSLAELASRIAVLQRETKNTKAVYTVITGGYVEPCSFDEAAREQGIDRLLLTDNSFLISREQSHNKGWTIVEVPGAANLTGADVQLFSRELKMKPYVFLKGYDKTLYIDGNVEVTAPLSDFFKMVGIGFNPENGMRFADIAIYSFTRNVEEEAKWVEDYAVKQNWLNRSEAQRQTKEQSSRYAAKYPELLDHYPGTFYGKIILRQHSHSMQKFGDIWFDEFTNGIRRDQLSFRYAALKAHLNVKVIERQCRETCNTYADPGFQRWFLKVEEEKHYAKL